MRWGEGGKSYHELLLDLAEALDAGGQFKVVVGRGLGDGRDDGNPVALGADVMGGGNAGDVDVCDGTLAT